MRSPTTWRTSCGGHAPVDRRGDDDLDVLDAVIGEELEHDGEHALADVGPAHGRQRERDVVDRDDDLHPGPQLGVERIAAEGVVDRVADGRVDVLEGVDGRPRVDDARADGQVDLEDLVAAEDGPRRAALLDRDDERVIAAGRAGAGDERGRRRARRPAVGGRVVSGRVLRGRPRGRGGRRRVGHGRRSSIRVSIAPRLPR